MARPRRNVLSMEQFLNNEREGYISNDVSIQRFPAYKPIIDGLAVTILTDDYIPAIILAEDGSGRTVIVDGGSRTTAFKMLRYGNYKIKSSVENPIIHYKKMDKDENGKQVWTEAEFDIRNKTYEQFPKELQKKFDEYQVETVVHECDEDTINMYFRRYNVHTGMNANQKMFIYITKFAEKIREITKKDFFIRHDIFSDTEKDKGTLERVVCESAMATFHLDKWNKNGKKLAMYLNENASEEEFDKLDNNFSRLNGIITEDTKMLFNSKDCFVWMALFERFTQYGLDDTDFGNFLKVFVNGLRNKKVDDMLFDTIDETGSTKDKRVINNKLHILETLMKEYLHIEDDLENMNKEEFIVQNVGVPMEEVKQDIDTYEKTLKDLEDKTIRDGSKLLNEENQLSLLAMVAYSYKNDVDLDDWMEEYASKNNTYITNQCQNFLYMIKSLKQFQEKGKVG